MLGHGATGISAINTIRSVIGVNLDTLRPEPSVEGFTTAGGYSCRAVKPIALRMVMEVAQVIRHEFPDVRYRRSVAWRPATTRRSLSCSAATQCKFTGVMKFGYEHVKPMCEQLLAFMAKHKFETLADFKGKSLDYFTTHADLVKRHAERKAAQKAAPKHVVKADGEWHGDDFVKQSDALSKAG